MKTSCDSTEIDLAHLPLSNGNHQSARVSRSKSNASLGPDASQNTVDSTSGTEDDALAVDGTVDLTQSSQAHKSGNAFGGSETLHFAMSVEASVAPKPRLQRKLRTRALEESTSTPKVPHNPWQKGDPRREDTLPEPHNGDGGQRSSEAYTRIQAQSLPDFSMAERLFELYFEMVNPIWPFLIEGQCRDLFNRTWGSRKQLDPLWIAQLNLIYCLSWQFYNEDTDITSHLNDSPRPGYEFYSRARELIVAKSLDVVSISMVQALLLMALYQQNTLRSRQCYLTVGHAARVAQELGLHIPLPDGQGISSLDKELRLRLWWGCFSLDR